MTPHLLGCNFQTASVELRERLAFAPDEVTNTLNQLTTRHSCEAMILSTCNRVEMVMVPTDDTANFGQQQASEFLSESRKLPSDSLRNHVYYYQGDAAIRHLCRVASSLDSLIVGEGQIAGQVKQAYELAHGIGATGSYLNRLVPHVLRTAKRVRTETGIAVGHVSVSSVAVDYVRQVFDHFHDKTVLIIGAGKMGRLTLKHLQELQPGRILVTNRSPLRAKQLADACDGEPVPWEQLDDSLVRADIVVSTTGSAETIMTKERFQKQIRPRRTRMLVILDIAVPRDFDPAIHDGDRVCLFNIDDLTRVREQMLAKRRAHVPPAEAIIEAEVKRFQDDWDRRRSGPVISQLNAEVDKLRDEVLGPLLSKLDGSLSEADRRSVEYAFKLFQSKILHGPIAALQKAHRDGEGHSLLEALTKLFRLGE